MAIEINPQLTGALSPNGISVIWGGVWANNKAYKRNQGVSHLGSSYRAIRTTTEEPSDTAVDWEILASSNVLSIGEANTASNVGTAGVGIFKQKTETDLEFKNINAGSSKITITDDLANSEVGVDVNEANINLANLAGTLPINKGGTGSTNATNALTALGAASDANLTAHTENTSNPHNTTAAQVGNTTAQWNADKLQGINVLNTTPTNGQVLTYNSTDLRWQPQTSSAVAAKLLQFKHTSASSAVVVNSANYTAVGLSITHSMSSASNLIYISGVIRGVIKSSSATNDTIYVAILRINYSGTNVFIGGNYGRFTTSYIPDIPFQVVIAPGTTASRTYAVEAFCEGSISFSSSLAPSIMTLTELTP